MPRRYVVAVAASWLLAAAPSTPGSLSIPRPARPSPIVPAILGTWRAGPVWAVDFKTGQMHLDHSLINPDLSDSRLMPCGQRLEFTNGYDKAANVAYWQVMWLLPYPPMPVSTRFSGFATPKPPGYARPIRPAWIWILQLG